MQCPKCGNPVSEGQQFCTKCGQSLNTNSIKMPQQPSAPRMAAPRPAMPQRPQAPQVISGDAPRVATPQRPLPPQSVVGKAPQRPQAPVAPQQPQAPVGSEASQKGWFTNGVRAVANAMTGGALNRSIANEQQQALRTQQRDAQQQIQEAQRAQQSAENEAQQALREAERQRDRRAMEAVDGVDVVRGRAIWSIQPGEIGRRISERELEEIEKLKGIIVQEGCTAIVFANGELVANLSAGAYLFYKSIEEEQAALQAAIEKAQKEMDEAEKRRLAAARQNDPTFRQLGIVGEIGRGVRWLGRIIFGEKKPNKKDPKERQLDYARILARLTQAPILSVYLVSNRVLNLTFGAQPNADGGIDFKPYVIPMGIQNVEVGVSLQMRINDIHAFATNYLSDRNSATVAQMQQLLLPAIEQLLRQQLRNTDYQSTGLDAQVVEQLKQQIQMLINAQVFGMECTQVLSVTDNNADFERFRSVERELYNTERELDFMQRTGEFRNRMEVESNTQQLNTARNAEELRHALQLLNKDQLLHDDELEEFVLLLQSQKRIREAKTQEQEYEALMDLGKSRLIKDDELQALQNDLAQKRIPREEITQIMRIQSQQKVDDANMQAEFALSDKRTDHEWEREDLERRRNWRIEDEEREREWLRDEREYNRDFARRKQEDDYDFASMMRNRQIEREDHLFNRNEKIEDEERARRNRLEDEALAHERNRQSKFDDDQLDANRAQRQIDKLQAMAQMQSQLDAQRYQHEEHVESIRANEQMNRDNQFANMTAEQIRAAQLSHISEEAQVAMANAYNGEKEAELLRQQAAKDEARMQADREAMAQDKQSLMNFAQQMAGMVRDTATQVSGAQQQMQQQQINELKGERQYAQQRQDHIQDLALNNISQVSTAAAQNIAAYNNGANIMQQRQAQQAAQTKSAQVTPQNGAEPAAVPAGAEIVECECYNCHHTLHIAAGTPQCPDCGAPFQW